MTQAQDDDDDDDELMMMLTVVVVVVVRPLLLLSPNFFCLHPHNRKPRITACDGLCLAVAVIADRAYELRYRAIYRPLGGIAVVSAFTHLQFITEVCFWWPLAFSPSVARRYILCKCAWKNE